MLCLSLSIIPVKAQTIEEQREQFQNAGQALRAGRLTTYRNITESLKDYPLYPYLLYSYLRPRLYKVQDDEIIDFLHHHGDLPVAGDLRRAWLKRLALQGRWKTFLENYTLQNDTAWQCLHLQARMHVGETDALLEDIRTVWLAGKSQPDECDPAFDLLYKSRLMTPELVWERIRLAMRNGKISLASYLARRLDSRDREWLSRWIATYRDPSRWTGNPDYEDTAIAAEILVHGLIRLARSDIDKTIARWESLKKSYTFTREQQSEIARILAVRSVLGKHPSAAKQLAKIDPGNTDESIFHWRLRYALENEDWPALVKWTAGDAPEGSGQLRWKYWRARALEQTGEKQLATAIYRSLAGERDYYGFLAADRISVPYRIGHVPLSRNTPVRETVLELTAIRRAHELYMIGDRYQARREWYYALQDMTSEQMQAAALLAADWGWHDRVILTLGQAEAFDDITLRFPLVFRDEMEKYAEKRRLDIGWIYAVARAESAFMTDARSPAGALGLMQIMPATGRKTARSIGFRTYRNSYLIEADKNITIGSAYLKQMHDRFGNLVLATAAYNAGPGAVSRWLPANRCIEPDRWVEMIPFQETRRYVARVLFFATIYDWRLKDEVIRVNERMAAIHPKQQLLAARTCPISPLS